MKRSNFNSRLRELIADLVQSGLTLEQAREEFERQYIAASIQMHDGNLGRTARALGIHRNTLRNKLSKLGNSPD